jgi:hypothetical protein
LCGIVKIAQKIFLVFKKERILNKFGKLTALSFMIIFCKINITTKIPFDGEDFYEREE